MARLVLQSRSLAAIGRIHNKWQSKLVGSTLADAIRRYSVVDLRSDTVTSPSKAMLEFGISQTTGDDVMGEDPTVQELEGTVASLTGKEAGLFVPTSTMANLTAIMSHCHGRHSELYCGQFSHIANWEGGNAATIAGVYPRQLAENCNAELPLHRIRRSDDTDNHFATTTLVCIENTHNLLGGKPLQLEYLQQVQQKCQSLNLKLHMDGARVWNAHVALNLPLSNICQHVDSVSLCLSKGLGAPLGSVLVGDRDFIQRARKHRKHLGGGMRQVGVVAAMGLYAIRNHVSKLPADHERAQFLATYLRDHGLQVEVPSTNMVYFELPKETMSHVEFSRLLKDKYNVKVSGGYQREDTELFRLATHLDLTDEGVERSAKAIVEVACKD